MKQNRAYSFLAIFTILALVFCAIPTGTVKAASLCVNTDGSDGCYSSIQSAVDAAAAGDTITVAAGKYVENVIVNKAITLVGAGADVTTIVATNGGSTPLSFSASSATVDGFTITHEYTPEELAAWIFNNNGVLFMQSGGNNTLQNCTVSLSRNGIYLNNTQGNSLKNNTITNNRTGINTTNNVNGLQIIGNTISANWTLGLVYYQSGYTTNFSTWNVSGNTFNANWYSEVLVKNAGVSTGVLDLSANTFTDSPVTYTNSADASLNEPSFDSQKPVSLGGTAIKPAVDLPTLRIYNSATASLGYPAKTLEVGSGKSYATIQSAIDAASAGDIISVAAGTYTENVNVNKSVEIAGAGQGQTIVIPATSGPTCSSGGGSLCAGSSNVFVVAANDVTIHDLTVDGDNPALTSAINAGGANLDARNGIIKSTSAAFTNMEVYNTTVKNIYLRGIYSTGGSFNFHNNTVSNVQAEYASIAIFAWGGPGVIQSNSVSDANDAISANHSNGIQFLNNTVTNSQSGIHTDNSGDSGGVPDVISGNTVSNCTPGGYGIWTFANNQAVTVSNNTVSNCALPYSIWGSRGTALATFTNNVATAPASPAGSVGMYVTTDLVGYGYSNVNAQISGNRFTGFENGIYLDAAQQSWESGAYVEETINAEVYHNQIVGSTLMQADRSASGHFNVDLTENWWGNAGGPQISKMNAAFTYAPWCADAACTSLAPVDGKITLPNGVGADEIQQAIDNAPANTIIVIPAGTYNFSDGYHVDNPHLTLLLKNGVIIQNSSPCFDVNASYTTITTESAGGAKCVPTNGANGINVANGLQNIIIQGLEIDGTAQTTGDGIHFAGAITDVQVLDNYIHALGGNGLAFAATPAGVVDIQGNLFKANTGFGVSAPADVDVSYNSWGSKDGAVAGDGVSSAITSIPPYTHVEISMTSGSSTPWDNQVLPGYSITYTVKGNFQSVLAADFAVAFPTNLTLNSTTLGSYFTTPAPGHSVIETSGNTIHFAGTANTAVSGDDLVLYTATFTAGTAGYGALQFATTSDKFAMLPAEGPSTNVYASALSDGAVNVISALPTLNTTGLAVPFTVGHAQEFSLVINNPLAGVAYSNPQVRISLPAGATLEYYNGSTWATVTGGSIDLAALTASGTDVTVPLRVTFTSPASVAFSASLYDTVEVTPDALLATTSTNIDVRATASLTGTFSMQGRTTRAGVPVTLTGTLFGALSGSSIDQISNNLVITGVISYDTYTLTTNQARYLNVTADLVKTVAGNKGTMNALELKGGNAVWTDNVIDVYDASRVGADWGVTGDGDVNFSGKVDIFDLAIVGGNYNLTSLAAYGTWVP